MKVTGEKKSLNAIPPCLQNNFFFAKKCSPNTSGKCNEFGLHSDYACVVLPIHQINVSHLNINFRRKFLLGTVSQSCYRNIEISVHSLSN